MDDDASRPIEVRQFRPSWCQLAARVLSIGLPLQQTRQLVSHDARISGYHGSVRERLPCADVNRRFCDTYV